MISPNKVILVTAGDPASISTEITIKAIETNRINQRNLNDTLSQISLNDFLVMKNWIMYAKKIGDENYKKFDENIVISEYIEKELASNLINRISEFNKNKTTS